MLKNYSSYKQLFFINKNSLVFLHQHKLTSFVMFIEVNANFHQNKSFFMLKFSKMIWQEFMYKKPLVKIFQNTMTNDHLTLMNYKMKTQKVNFNTFFMLNSIIFKKSNFNEFFKFNWQIFNLFLKNFPIKIMFFLLNYFTLKFFLSHYSTLMFLCLKQKNIILEYTQPQLVLKSHSLLRFMPTVNLIKYNWNLL